MLLRIEQRDDFKAASKNGFSGAKKPAGNVYLDRNGIWNTRPSWDAKVEWQLEDEESVSKAKSWLMENMILINNYSNAMGSYKLKHVVEENIGMYVSNGQVIALMRQLGFNSRFYYSPNLSLNCSFNAAFRRGVTRKNGELAGVLFRTDYKAAASLKKP